VIPTNAAPPSAITSVTCASAMGSVATACSPPGSGKAGYRGLSRGALASEPHAGHSAPRTTGVLAEHTATLIAAQFVLRTHCGFLGTRG
jgi:hypothetical protein